MGGKSKLEKAQFKRAKLKANKRKRKIKKEEKKVIRQFRKSYKKEPASIEEIDSYRNNVKAYRYSVAFFNGSSADSGKTFRAEVITLNRQDKDRIRVQLINSLDNKMNSSNSGLRRMYKNSSFLGLEAEEVGNNDISSHVQLNRIYVTID